MRDRPILVVDTNLFVSALFVGSAAARSILGRILRTALVVFCPETVAELEAKSRLSKFDRYTTLAEREEAVAMLAKIAQTTAVTEMVRICRDPKDDMFLALAKTVSADAVVSGDKDLLVLGNFEDIMILTPRQWCDRMDDEGQASSGE